jgi:hypothetical protein
MEPVDITWARAFKVWWSYSWRAMVLSLIAMVPLQILLFTTVFTHLPAAGQRVDPGQFAKYAPVFMLGWLLMMALFLALQTQGMRWMLRDAKWSDFRIALLPKDG